MLNEANGRRIAAPLANDLRICATPNCVPENITLFFKERICQWNIFVGPAFKPCCWAIQNKFVSGTVKMQKVFKRGFILSNLRIRWQVSRFRNRVANVALAILLLIPSATRAADPSESNRSTSASPASESLKKSADENHYYLALGPVMAPDYEGSDNYEIYPLAIARWIRGGAYVEFRGATLSANLIPMSLFQAGPMLRWHRARDDVSDKSISRMRDIDGTLEAGGFFGVMLRDPDAPRRRIGTNVRILQDVLGSHDGYEIRLVLEGGLPLHDKWSLETRVFSSYASKSYMDTYFSVDPDNAARSGLEQFHADAGFKDVGLNAMLTYHLTEHFGIGLIGSYKRFIGSAGDSPVVDTAGSRNTFVGAMVATVVY